MQIERGGNRGGRNSEGRWKKFRFESWTLNYQLPQQYSQNRTTPKAPQSSYTYQNTGQQPKPNYYNQLSRSGVQFQICGKYNHTALECRQRINHSYVPDDLPHSFAAMNLNVPEEE